MGFQSLRRAALLVRGIPRICVILLTPVCALLAVFVAINPGAADLQRRLHEQDRKFIKSYFGVHARRGVQQGDRLSGFRNRSCPR
jgi:hypothetical protein